MYICPNPYLPANPGLLQKELFYPGSFYHTVTVEVNINVFPKPAWIVISNCLGISKSWWARDRDSIWIIAVNAHQVYFLCPAFFCWYFTRCVWNDSADKHCRMSGLRLPPKERGRHTVHTGNSVLKDVFKCSKCSQPIWPAKRAGQVWRPPEGLTGNRFEPSTEKDGYVRSFSYRYIHDWPVTLSLSSANAKPGVFTLGSAFPGTLVLPAIPGYLVGAAVDFIRTWQKSIQNFYPASPVFQDFSSYTNTVV